MKFKVDENLPIEIAGLLREAGYGTETIHEEGLQGCIDNVLLNQCQHEGRILVTLDLDFSDIRRYPPEKYPGLIIIRVGTQSKHEILAVFRKAISLLKQMQPTGQLWIVQKDRIRIRLGENEQQ